MADGTRQASRNNEVQEQRMNKMEEIMAEIARKVDLILSNKQAETGEEGEISQSQAVGESTMRPNLNGNRVMKIDMPRFVGENPGGWIFKVEQHFAYSNIPEEQRITMISMLMDGPALSWFQSLHNNLQLTTWDRFKESLMNRFGPSPYRDLKGELTKLIQQTSVQDFYNQFEELSNQVSGVPPSFLQSCFESGLRHDIRREVRALQPTSLEHAFQLVVEGSKQRLNGEERGEEREIGAAGRRLRGRSGGSG